MLFVVVVELWDVCDIQVLCCVSSGCCRLPTSSISVSGSPFVVVYSNNSGNYLVPICWRRVTFCVVHTPVRSCWSPVDLLITPVRRDILFYTFPSIPNKMLMTTDDDGGALRWTSTHQVLCCTAPRTAFASQAFCHVAPAVWNELSNSLNFIHSTVSLSEFKRNLKSFLFKQSFPVWSRDWSAPEILL